MATAGGVASRGGRRGGGAAGGGGGGGHAAINDSSAMPRFGCDLLSWAEQSAKGRGPESRDSTSSTNGEGNSRRGELYCVERGSVEGRPGATAVPAQVGTRRSHSNSDQFVPTALQGNARAVTTRETRGRLPGCPTIDGERRGTVRRIRALVVASNHDAKERIGERDGKDTARSRARRKG
jgi:hypothetical protein